MSHDSSSPSRLRIGGAFDVDQVWPYEMPGPLAKCPPPKLPRRYRLAPHGFGRPHVTPTGQALVEVLLIDRGKLGKSAPLGGGDFCAHAPYGSDSLDKYQAIRYGNEASTSLENPAVETNNERRLRKLTDLCIAHGGVGPVAEKSGLNAATLDQIIKKTLLPPKKGGGSRSERALGDPAARAIEEAYGLGRGWFDNDGDDLKMTPKEMQLLGYFRELDAVLQQVVIENVREAVEERALLAERLRAPTRAKTTDRMRSGSFLGGQSSGFGGLDQAKPGKAKK